MREINFHNGAVIFRAPDAWQESRAAYEALGLLCAAERMIEPGCKVDFTAERRIALPFSRQQIADLLGLTIETVSRQFTRLKADGVIELPSPREVVVRDHEALLAEAG